MNRRSEFTGMSYNLSVCLYLHVCLPRGFPHFVLSRSLSDANAVAYEYIVIYRPFLPSVGCKIAYL